MATLDELVSAFKAADDAGNTEDARAFANAIRQIQGGNVTTPEAPKKETRSWADALIDPGASFLKGVGNLAQFPEQLAELASGKPIDDTFLTRAGKGLETFGQNLKSTQLKQKELALSEKIGQQEGFWNEAKTAIGGTISDPALLSNFIFEQIPNFIGSGGAGAISKGAVKLFLKDATEVALAKAGVRGAVVTEAAMQGVDSGGDAYERIYEELKKRGVPEQQAQTEALTKAREAAISSGGISYLTSLIPGARTIEKAITRSATPSALPSNAIDKVGKFLGEPTSELIQEGTGQLTSNIAVKDVIPETDIMKGVGAASGMGALGGFAFGLPANILNNRQNQQQLNEARQLAAETNEPQPVPLQLGYEGDRSVGTFIVHPDGSVSTSEEEAFKQRYKNQPVEQVPPPVYQLGYDPTAGQIPFHVFPDGSIATSDDEAFKKMYSPQQIEKIKEEALRLGYDRTAGQTPFYVMPDGSVGTSQDMLLAQKYKPQPMFPPGRNEAYASEADRLAVEKFRAEEARKNSPAMQELDKIKAEAEKRRADAVAKIDKKYASQSQFAENAPVGGVFRAPTQEEIDAEKQREATNATYSYMPVGVVGKDGIQIFAGTLSKNGKAITYTDNEGKKRTYQTNNKNIIVNPTEQDVLQKEAEFFDKERSKVEGSQASLRGANQETTNKFKKFLRKNPIEDKYADDILDDIKRALNPSRTGYNPLSKTASKGFFVEGGNNLDELASMAHDQGFISDEEFNDPRDTGGVKAFMAKVNQVYKGNYIESNINADKLAELEQSRAASDVLEKEIDARKERLQNLPTAEDIAAEQNAGFQKYIADNTDRFRSDIAALQQQYGNLEQFDYTKPDGQPGNRAIDEISKKYAEEYFKQPKAEKAEKEVNPTDKFFAEGEQLLKDMRKALDKMGLSKVGLRLEETLTSMIEGKEEPVTGLYDAVRNLISVSLSSSNPIRSLNHEALHALKELGMFSPKEWAMLESKARSTWMEKYNIARDYGHLEINDQLEEAIAKAFGDYGSNPAPVQTLINRAKNFLKSIGNFLIGRGYDSVDKIFQRARAGELKGAGVRESRQTTERAERTKDLKMEGVNEAYADKIRNQFSQKKATVMEKINDFKPNLYERIITGLFDEFRAIKKYSEKSYMLARMSKSIDGALEGLLMHGQVELDGGALNLKKDTKGLIEILKPLGAEVDQYQIWKALNRDSRMPSDKRSFSDDLVNGRNELTKGTLNGKPRAQVYESVLREENALNKSVLDVAKQQGLLDDESYKRFSDDIYYIPFYKAVEDGTVEGIHAASKLSNQKFSKALKGGEKKTNDFMENVLMNWSHILSASMKNAAAVDTLKTAEKMNGAERVKSTYEGKDVVKVQENGKQTYWAVTDPFLFDSIALISYMGPKSPFLNIAKGFTNMLRYGVTLSPAYKLRNLIRDSIQSAATSGLSMGIMDNVYNGMKLSNKGHPTFMQALMGGGIFEMGTAHEGDQAKLIKKLVRQGVDMTSILDNPSKIKDGLQKALDWYNEQGNRFENANRLALYDKLRKEGKSHLEASYAARDLMDFSLQGSWPALKIISQVVPFFNARLQGLYKLGRDGITPTYRVLNNTLTGKEITGSDKQKALHFATISSAVMLASMMLYMAFKDDEDFKRREDWDRDNFWWFKAGDVIYRIPKPFEIGALGTVAERTLEQIYDENVEGKVFVERMHKILSDTFSLNPMPQVFKPMVDLYANKDSFTNAPIESAGMERLSKQERQTDSTSALAKALGGISEIGAKILTFNPEAEGLSPIQMDYAIKAYLGWAGATAAAVSDKAVQPWSDVEKPSKPLVDTVAMGFVKTMPETQSKYVSDFYENNTRMNQALADMKRYAEIGDMDKVNKILEEKGDLIALQGSYDKAVKQMAEMRKYMNFINRDKDMSSEDKRNELARMKILISELAMSMEDIRKSMKK